MNDIYGHDSLALSGRRRKRLALGCYALAFQAGKCTNSRRRWDASASMSGAPYTVYFHVRIQR